MGGFAQNGIPSIHLNDEAGTYREWLLNFHQPLDLGAHQNKYKVPTAKGSLFYVSQHAGKDERLEFSISGASTRRDFSAAHIVSDGDTVTLKKKRTQDACIISYFYEGEHSRRSARLKWSGMLDGNGGKMYELLYFSERVTALEKQKYETYLSFKFGISLESGQYVLSSGDTIWNASDEKKFAHRVTALGRDDGTGLYQKQSENAAYTGFVFSVGKPASRNRDNRATLNDGDYFLWADDGVTPDWSADSTIQGERLGRVWKARFSDHFETDVPLTLSIDSVNTQSLMGDKLPQHLRLAYIETVAGEEHFELAGATYLAPSVTPNGLVFEKLPVLPGKQLLFTFVYTERLALTATYQPDCRVGTAALTLDVIGGSPPYEVELVTATSKNEVRQSGSRGIYDVPFGPLDIQVTDAKGVSVRQAHEIYSLGKGTDLVFPDKWILFESGGLTVYPTGNLEGLDCIWYKGDIQIGNGTEQEFREKGSYRLEVHSPDGCSMLFPFDILAEKPSAWHLYPNTVAPAGKCRIETRFERKQSASLLVIDPAGKRIIARHLGVIDQYGFDFTVAQPGVYLVSLIVDGTAETKKLIVK